jgi:hypothetical protein
LLYLKKGILNTLCREDVCDEIREHLLDLKSDLNPYRPERAGGGTA